jgi:hypothetical protein
MRLFPYALLRAAGAPFDSFASLRAVGALETSRGLRASRERLAGLELALCDALSARIGEIAGDPKSRSLLITLKRDVFNQRPAVRSSFAAARPLLPDELCRRIEEVIAMRDDLTSREECAAAAFAGEKRALRRRLAALAKQPALQNGLVLSSRSLQKSINEHYAVNHDRALRSRDLDTELGLLKYLSRLHAKTSPFSTFTTVTCVPLAAGGAALQKLGGNGQHGVRSEVRLNTALNRTFVALLVAREEVWPLLPVRPNPTLRAHEGQFVFLTSSNNVEAFQRLDRDEALEMIVRLTPPASHPSCMELAGLLRENGVDASDEELLAYLRQLFDFGFLELGLEVSGVDPDWDQVLYQKLQPLAASLPAVVAICDALRRLRESALAYGLAGFERRSEIVGATYESLRELFAALAPPAEEPAATAAPAEAASAETGEVQPFTHRYSTAFALKPEQIFLEDATLDLRHAVDAAAIQPFIDVAARLMSGISPVMGGVTDMMRMSEYFASRDWSGPVSLLTFYEDFYRDVKLREARRAQAAPPADAAEVEPPAKMKAVIQRCREWLDSFAHRLSGDGAGGAVVHLTVDDLRFGEPAPAAPSRSSYGMFLQVLSGNGHPRGVVNAIFPGYGKLMGRFLHFADSVVTDEMNAWNAALARDGELLAENRDGVYFNANLHPPLLPFEVWLPGAQGSLPADRQLRVSDFYVRAGEAGELALTIGPDGPRVYVFDLGFQGSLGRSQLFQLLSAFALPQNPSAFPLVGAINEHFRREADAPESPKKVVIQPRIVFEDTLILQRRSWRVPVEQLPVRDRNESEWSYFARVDHWREQLQIPEEVFVVLYLRDAPRPPQADPKKRSALKRDDYKPQYISFANPLLVSLFEQMAKRAEGWLRVEEMLPGAPDLASIGGERYVTELVLQWYEGLQ